MNFAEEKIAPVAQASTMEDGRLHEDQRSLLYSVQNTTAYFYLVGTVP